MSQQKLQLAFGVIKPIPRPDVSDLFRIKTHGDAWRETLMRSRRPRKAVAQEVGIHNTTLTKVLNNERSMPDEYRDTFQEACGNDFYDQWWAFQRGYRLVEREETPEEELERLRAVVAQRSA